MRVLLANWNNEDDAELEKKLFGSLASFDVQRVRPGESNTLSPDLAAQADGIINCSGTLTIGAAPEKLERCKICVRAGVGYDNLDLKALGECGIPVCNVPDYGTSEVADHAIALMLALVRGTSTYHDQVRQDPIKGWAFATAPLVRRIRGATFGVLGLGRIGHAAALRAKAFGMKILFFDPFLPVGSELAFGFDRAASLETLVMESDVLSIHVPLTSATEKMINERVLSLAKHGMILVNTARGAVIDLDALYLALREDLIGGAALDVLPSEPPNPDHPLISAWRQRANWIEGRLTITPHSAFYSDASNEDMRRKAVEVVLDYLLRGLLRNCVNQQYLDYKYATAQTNISSIL